MVHGSQICATRLAIALISVALPEAAGADGAFFGLGTLGKSHAKAPATFTPDRSHVVGYACDGGYPSLPCQPFVWRAGAPPSALALLPGDQNGYAFGISDDGR